MYLHKPYLYALLSIKKEKLILFIIITITITIIISNLFLIQLMGNLGAAITNLIGYSLSYYLFNHYAHKFILIEKPIKIYYLSRILILTFPAGLILIFIKQINPLLAILLFSISYLESLFLLGIISKKEIKLLNQSIRK